MIVVKEEEIEDTIMIIRIRKSTYRQHIHKKTRSKEQTKHPPKDRVKRTEKHPPKDRGKSTDNTSTKRQGQQYRQHNVIFDIYKL